MWAFYFLSGFFASGKIDSFLSSDKTVLGGFTNTIFDGRNRQDVHVLVASVAASKGRSQVSQFFLTGIIKALRF